MSQKSSRPRENVKPQFQYELPNSPGKSVVGAIVDYTPDGFTPPHRHGSASVTGYVLEGSILSKMNDDPERIYEAGESWFEAPGCHHKKSENPSKTNSAKLLAIFVVDSDFTSLIEFDDPSDAIVRQLSFSGKNGNSFRSIALTIDRSITKAPKL